MAKLLNYINVFSLIFLISLNLSLSIKFLKKKSFRSGRLNCNDNFVANKTCKRCKKQYTLVEEKCKFHPGIYSG